MSGKYFRKSFRLEGKRYFVTGKTEKEAIEKCTLKRHEVEQGLFIVESSIPLRIWAMRCIEIYKTNQKEITREKYISRINHCILDPIGDIPLKRIRPMALQEVLNLQTGKSKTQINEVYQAMRLFFRKAVENGLLNVDPSVGLVRPSGYKNTRRSITDKEREALLTLFSMDRRFKVFALMLYCGCRPSEARDVRTDDFTLDDGILLLKIRGTKTKNALRYVPVPPTLEALLHEDFALNAGYICTTSSGKHMTITDYRRAWKHLKRLANIELGCQVYRNQLIPPYPLADDFVPYCLRHTFCTDLQKKGVDIRTAQYLMGHATIEMTANIYTHLDKMDSVRVAAQIIK